MRTSWMLFNAGWFRIVFTFYINQGLGFLYAPQVNKFGITFFLWALVISWDDIEQDEFQYGEG